MPKLNLKMSDVINDRFRAQHFYRYAKKAFCAENLDFVYACRQISPTLGTAVFRPVPLSDASDPSRGAAYVYERFIQGPNNSTAREEVNINYSTKSEVREHNWDSGPNTYSLEIYFKDKHKILCGNFSSRAEAEAVLHQIR